jgi:hypothetical protein
MTYFLNFFSALIVLVGFQIFSGISGAGGWHGPVVFRDAAPEHPYQTDRQDGKERFEHGAVDSAVSCLADVSAGDELEYLPNGEKKPGSTQIN